MCYSKESSLYTSSVSFVAIVYLLTSGIPHFQWLGVTLLGWCTMQFAEYLLWSENPKEGCTETNKQVTSTLVPFAIFLQGVSALYGSLLVIPWASSSFERKAIIVSYTLASAVMVYLANLYNPTKDCTTVTEEGHLDWGRHSRPIMSLDAVGMYGWAFIGLAPIILLWNRSYAFLAAVLTLPVLGFLYGRYGTDSQASIWCYYTSWSSILAALGLFLKQTGTYDVLRA
jgi:hypothetical protein